MTKIVKLGTVVSNETMKSTLETFLSGDDGTLNTEINNAIVLYKTKDAFSFQTLSLRNTNDILQIVSVLEAAKAFLLQELSSYGDYDYD